MAKTVAGLLIERLLDWGVNTIFSLPGDGINGIFEAWRENQDKLKYIQVRHEEAAAFAACGYAKYTGRLGVCMATSGPGGIHLLNGLYDAKSDGQPVLAITGHTFHDLIGTHYQQDVDLTKLFQDVAVYNERVTGPAHVYNVVDEAIKTALARRGVAHINIPKDVQDCDTLIILGSSFPYQEFYPKPGKAKCVQVDLDPTKIGLRYPADIGLAGECKRVLQTLLPLVKRKRNRDFLKEAQDAMQKWN